jgi:hypothetical protein
MSNLLATTLAGCASVGVGFDGSPVNDGQVLVTVTNNKAFDVDVYWEDTKLFSVAAGKEMSISSFEGHTLKLKRSGRARTVKTCVVNSSPTQCTAGKSNAAAALAAGAAAKAPLAAAHAARSGDGTCSGAPEVRVDPQRAGFLEYVLQGTNISRAEFFSDYYGRQPLHIPNALRGHIDQLPGADSVEELAMHAASSLSLVKGGQDFAIELWRSAGQPFHSQENPANPNALLEAFGNGASIVVNSVQRSSPSSKKVVDWLEREFICAGAGNLYASPPALDAAFVTKSDVRAFVTHIDVHDVLVAHTSGKKTWSVYKPTAILPEAPFKWSSRYAPDGQKYAAVWAAATPLHEFALERGDLLYLPRGWPHHAQTKSTGEPAVHVTFQFGSHSAATVGTMLLHAIESVSHRSAFAKRLASPSLGASKKVSWKDVLGNSIMALAEERAEADWAAAEAYPQADGGGGGGGRSAGLQLRTNIPPDLWPRVVSVSAGAAEGATARALAPFLTQVEKVLAHWTEEHLASSDALSRAWHMVATTKADSQLQDQWFPQTFDAAAIPTAAAAKVAKLRGMVDKGADQKGGADEGGWEAKAAELRELAREVAAAITADGGELVRTALVSMKLEHIGTHIQHAGGTVQTHLCLPKLARGAGSGVRVRARYAGILLEDAEITFSRLPFGKQQPAPVLDTQAATKGWSKAKKAAAKAKGTVTSLAVASGGTLVKGFPGEAAPALRFLFEHGHSEAGFRFEDWDMGVDGEEKKKALLALMLQAEPNAMANLLDLQC